MSMTGHMKTSCYSKRVPTRAVPQNFWPIDQVCGRFRIKRFATLPIIEGLELMPSFVTALRFCVALADKAALVLPNAMKICLLLVLRYLTSFVVQ